MTDLSKLYAAIEGRKSDAHALAVVHTCGPELAAVLRAAIEFKTDMDWAETYSLSGERLRASLDVLAAKLNGGAG